jgi:hypothetical protein
MDIPPYEHGPTRVRRHPSKTRSFNRTRPTRWTSCDVWRLSRRPRIRGGFRPPPDPPRASAAPARPWPASRALTDLLAGPWPAIRRALAARSASRHCRQPPPADRGVPLKAKDCMVRRSHLSAGRQIFLAPVLSALPLPSVGHIQAKDRCSSHVKLHPQSLRHPHYLENGRRNSRRRPSPRLLWPVLPLPKRCACSASA